MTADLQKTKLTKLNFTAAAIGPGLGVSRITKTTLQTLLKLNSWPVVVDADALTVIARSKLKPLKKNWLITPHSGELARLLNTTAQTIQKNPQHFAEKAAQKLNCWVLLKGPSTYVTDGAETLVIRNGNSALAKAGTGDVLTGIILGFLAQGLSTKNAAVLGAFVHGGMAKTWVKSGRDPLSLLASDLLEMIPKELAKLRRAQ